MILENIMNNRVTQLYEMLTKSDFKGNVEDEYVVSLTYVMMCIDRCVNDQISFDRKHYVLLAREIIRIHDTGAEDVSYMVLTRAMIDYMKKKGKKYREIHSMNSYDLLNGVMEHMQEVED